MSAPVEGMVLWSGGSYGSGGSSVVLVQRQAAGRIALGASFSRIRSGIPARPAVASFWWVFGRLSGG